MRPYGTESKEAGMNEPVILKCPGCGVSLARGAISCRHCQSEFVQAVGAPAEKPVSQVVEKDGRKVVDGIFFTRWSGLGDSSLAALAVQIAETTPKILMAKPAGERAYTNFTLPLSPKAGRPKTLLAEVFKRDDVGFNVCLSAGFPSETHRWVREEGRVLSLPQE